MPTARAAEPQRAELDWRESYPAATGQRLVFDVDALDVTAEGWSADVAVTNRTPHRVRARRRSGPGFAFGLMLFATGDLEAARGGEPGGPAAGASAGDADRARPPDVLQPRADVARDDVRAPARSPTAPTSASLRAASSATTAHRPRFERVVWITDRAYRL